jgi:nitrate/TMAO reductase-like tetraheme cytochrome c subunit
MSKSIVTEYKEICFFCGRQAEGEHHLIFGTAGRELAEKDGLKVPTCNNCHNMGKLTERIHDNPMAEKLSKMLGQAIYEKEIGTREEFRKRYGKSYL